MWESETEKYAFNLISFYWEPKNKSLGVAGNKQKKKTLKGASENLQLSQEEKYLYNQITGWLGE